MKEQSHARMWIKLIIALTITLAKTIRSVRSEITCDKKSNDGLFLCSDAPSFGRYTLQYTCAHLYYVNYISIQVTSVTHIDQSTVHDCNPYELAMINGPLQDIHPRTFENFIELQGLYLFGNSIKKLQKEAFFIRYYIRQNNDLLIDLSSNQIDTIEDGAFNNDLVIRKLIIKLRDNELKDFNLSSVTVQDSIDVDVSFNKIAQIRGSTKKLLESSLEFGHNELNIFQMSVLGIGQFDYLGLSFNKLTNIICDPSSHRSIKNFNMTHNQILDFDLSCLGQNNEMNYVDLSYNQIQEISASHQKPNKIDLLYLNHNQIRSFNLSYIADLKIKLLNLSFNNITEITGDSVVEFDINKLDLSHNQIKSFNFSYLGNSNLTLLDLSINNISEIVNNPDHQPTVNKLDLSDNSLKTLPEFAFPQSTSSLDLSNNEIESINIKTFFDLGNLRYLNLSQNRLRNLQFGVFHYWDKLETLDLSNNRLVSQDLLTIYGLNALKTFYFHNNQIESLKLENFPPSLKTISFYGNKLNFTCIELYKFLQAYSQLKFDYGQRFDKHHVRGIACEHNPEEDKFSKNNIIEENQLGSDRSLKDSIIVDMLKNFTSSFNILSKSVNKISDNLINNNNTEKSLDAFQRIEEKHFEHLLKSFKLHWNHQLKDESEDLSTSLKNPKNMSEEQELLIQNKLELKAEAPKRNYDDDLNSHGSSLEKLNKSLNSISNQFTFFLLILLIVCIAFILTKSSYLKGFFVKKNPIQDIEEQSTRGLITISSQELAHIYIY